MEDALAHPIGAGLLAEEIHAGDTVCILTNDITRLTRSHIYIPILVRELNKAGVPDGDCVGNITAGGTGKTPHTEMILRTLLRSDDWATTIPPMSPSSIPK